MTSKNGKKVVQKVVQKRVQTTTSQKGGLGGLARPWLLLAPGLPWGGGCLSGGDSTTTKQGARARRLLHKKEVHDQARGALDMDHMQVQRETISMEEPTTKKRNDHTKERREGKTTSKSGKKVLQKGIKKRSKPALPEMTSRQAD